MISNATTTNDIFYNKSINVIPCHLKTFYTEQHIFMAIYSTVNVAEGPQNKL